MPSSRLPPVSQEPLSIGSSFHSHQLWHTSRPCSEPFPSPHRFWYFSSFFLKLQPVWPFQNANLTTVPKIQLFWGNSKVPHLSNPVWLPVAFPLVILAANNSIAWICALDRPHPSSSLSSPSVHPLSSCLNFYHLYLFTHHFFVEQYLDSYSLKKWLPCGAMVLKEKVM